MKLSLTQENENYAARLVELQEFEIIPDAQKIKHAIINSNRVIVAATCQTGDKGVFFPIEAQIDKAFLSANSLFSDKFSNKDQTKVGFFDKHGRVRAVKLRGAVSEGFFIGLEAFKTAFNIPVAEWDSVPLNQAFDTLTLDSGDIQICKKYIIREAASGLPRIRDNKNKTQTANRLIPGEYILHHATPKLVDQIHLISPSDMLTVSNKLHGTSVAMGRVLVKKKLSLWEKTKKFFGFKVELTEYDNIYSSRSVIKENAKTGGYYDSDVWRIAFDQVKGRISDGMQLYGEIVGFTPSGSYIQRGYSYGQEKGTQKFYLYRITTKENGEIREWEMPEVLEWAKNNSIDHVPVFYQGLAKDLFPELDIDHHWSKNFIDKLRNSFNMEKTCELCVGENVPAEGLCIRVHGKNLPAFKFKSFKFLMKESKDLDVGVVDIESAESQPEFQTV